MTIKKHRTIKQLSNFNMCKGSFAQKYNAFRVQLGLPENSLKTIDRYTRGGSGYEKGVPKKLVEFMTIWAELDACSGATNAPHDAPHGFLEIGTGTIQYSFYVPTSGVVNVRNQAVKGAKQFADMLTAKGIKFTSVEWYKAQSSTDSSKSSYKIKAVIPLK